MAEDASQLNFSYKFQPINDQIIIVNLLKESRCLFREIQLKKLVQNTSLVVQYNFQHKSKSIKCIKINSEPGHDNLQKILSKIFDSIKIYKLSKTGLNINDKFVNLCKTIELEQYMAMKLIREQQGRLKIGDLLIFAQKQKQQASLQMIRKIRNFQNQQLEYSLSQWMQDHNVKYQLQKKLSYELSIVLYKPLVSLAQKLNITVLDLSSQINNQDRISLKFEVQGLSNTFIPFYRQVQNFINLISIKILETKDVYCKGKDLVNLMGEDTYSFVIKDFLILAKPILKEIDQQQFQKLINKIQTSQWLIKQQFKPQHFQLIEAQKQQLKRFIIQKQIQHENLIINKNYIMIKCDRQSKNAFVKYVRDFLQQKKRVITKCANFKSRHVSQCFIKYFAEEINSKFYCQLFIEDQQLKRKNYDVDNEDIQEIIEEKRLKLIRKLVRVYTLQSVYTHPLYSIQVNPQETKYESLACSRYKIGKKIFINISPISSISKFMQNVIIIYKQEMLQHLFLNKIFKQNNISISTIKSLLNAKNPQYLIEQSTYNSRYFHNIIMWAIPSLKTHNSNKTLKKNINDIIQKMIPKQKINIFIPGKQFKPFQNLISEFLYEQLEQQKNQGKNSEAINFYVESKECKEKLERLLRTQTDFGTQLKNSLYITPKTIDKIINLRYFTLSYYENQKTKITSPMNSFIFHHQIKYDQHLNLTIKVPLILPKQTNQLTKQYLIDFPNKCYYIIKQNNQILKRKALSEMPNLEMKKMVQAIKQKFKKIQYLVTMGSQNPQRSILQNLNIYYVKNDEPGILTSVYLDTDLKLKIKSDRPALPYEFQKINNIKYFAIETIEDELQKVKQFLAQHN